MFFDILIELGTEKIRQDFGDLCATVFQIITYQNGCSLKELNFFLPKLNYSILRTSLFILFQHNILFFPIKMNDNLKRTYLIENIRLFSRIYEPIYRIRHYRFMALSEHEYGEIGGKIIKNFVKKGQLFLKDIFKEIFFRNNLNKFKTEDLLIHMARDGLIQSVLATHLFHNIIGIYKKKKSLPKPLIKKIKFSWKISTSKFNLFLRINLIIEIAREYYGGIISKIIRGNICKTLAINSRHILLIWFSFDTLNDNVNDLELEQKFNDVLIFQAVNEFSLSEFFIEIKSSVLKIIFKKLLEIISNKIIEKLIFNQFGNKFALIFKTILEKTKVSEKEIENDLLIEECTIRKTLFKMFRLGYIYIDEMGKFFDFLNFKKVFYWKINYGLIKKRLISEILKSIFNLILKIEDLEIILSKILINDSYKKNISCRPNYLNSQVKTLLLSLRRLDEILFMIYV
jgi:transcription initiation factor IIE alpha subunit